MGHGELMLQSHKMIIPHIRTTFPASVMFQVDGGSEDELALLFAENQSINTTGAEEDSAEPPGHHDQLEEEKQAKTSPTNTITIATNEEDELTKSPSPPKDSNNTTTAEEVHTDPMVEELSVNAVTKEGDSTTPPIRCCQQGKEAKMWTSVPLLQRISSSNE